MSDVGTRERLYIESGGVKCPYCRSENIEGGSRNMDGNWISFEVTCLECKRDWEDIYTLTGVELKE
jgi:DNA-directed RNA polymerase subunit RPC12/RpoP